MRAHIMSVLAAAAVMATATIARADEWFVAPGGAGDGSAASPFGAIQDGLDVAQAGDVITPPTASSCARSRSAAPRTTASTSARPTMA